jgi:hypothetical protein
MKGLLEVEEVAVEVFFVVVAVEMCMYRSTLGRTLCSLAKDELFIKMGRG